jgi:YfiH family protein
MIRSEAIPGVAFGTEADGDGRSNASVRATISDHLGIPSDWATVSQVHGSNVVQATRAGALGEADGLLTERSNLPIAVATADCIPIAIAGEGTIAIVHAGWRGVSSGVVTQAITAMGELGDTPLMAVIGPHIGPCCYEVGGEVIDAVGGYEASTRWGTTSVDLAAAVEDQLAGVPVERLEICTMDDERFASFRRNGTRTRQVAVAWNTQA